MKEEDAETIKGSIAGEGRQREEREQAASHRKKDEQKRSRCELERECQVETRDAPQGVGREEQEHVAGERKKN